MPTHSESIFSQLEALGHKKIVFCSDPDAGLKAIIAIHHTTLELKLNQPIKQKPVSFAYRQAD